MKKLFKEFGEEISKYKMENDCLDFYYIADDINFKKQITIKDYYRIILVNNTENLTVENLNKKIEDLKNKNLINFSYDTCEDAVEILNREYNLTLELEESVFYDDLDYFKNGCIVYDKERNLFDLAENWAVVVTTYLYKEEVLPIFLYVFYSYIFIFHIIIYVGLQELYQDSPNIIILTAFQSCFL